MNLQRSPIIAPIIALTLLLLILVLNPGCKNEVIQPPRPENKWEIFTASNTAGIRDGHIYQITVDYDGKVWFATRNGAIYHDGGFPPDGYWGGVHDSLSTITYFSGAPPETSYVVYSIAHAKDRAVWFALNGGGVMRYNPSSDRKVWERFTSGNGAFDYPLSLAADRSSASLFGEIWVTSVTGVSQYIQSANETGIWKQYRKDDNVSTLPTNRVWVVAIKPDDNSVWFGTQLGGPAMATYSVSGTLSWNAFPFPPPLDSKINAIGFDSYNTAWFGTDTGGVAALNRGDGSWNIFSRTSSDGRLPGGRVNAVITNSEKVRWFGTDSGLVRLNDNIWTRFTHDTTHSPNETLKPWVLYAPLPSDTITSLQYDLHDNLWIGTPSGIAVYNEGGVR